MTRRRDPRGRSETEHWTKTLRSTMEEPAWRTLSPTAQALYPWLKFEWHGPTVNNNGKIRLSVRDAAKKVGVGKDAAARAFQELQAKGFIVVTEFAQLGTSGAAKAPAYELTELALPHGEKPEGRKLYRDWRPGRDFPIHGVSSNNPSGRNGKTKSRPENDDSTVIKIGTKSENLSRK